MDMAGVARVPIHGFYNFLMQGWKGFNTYLQAAHDGWDPVEEEYNDYSTAYTVEWEDDEKVYEDYEDDDDELIYDYSRLNMTDG